MNLLADFGMRGQQLSGESFEVVEIESFAFIFARLIFELSLVKQAMDGGKMCGKFFIQREAGFFSKEFEMLVVGVAQVFHRFAHGFNVVPVGFLSLRGNGFAEGGEGRENFVPIFRNAGAGLLDFIPFCENRLAREFEFVFGRVGLV